MFQMIYKLSLYYLRQSLSFNNATWFSQINSMKLTTSYFMHKIRDGFMNSWCHPIQNCVGLILSTACSTKPFRQLQLEITLVLVFIFDSLGEVDEQMCHCVNSCSLFSTKSCDRQVLQVVYTSSWLWNSLCPKKV